MENSKRKTGGILSEKSNSKKTKPPQPQTQIYESSNTENLNSSSQSQPSVGSQVDSVAESPSTKSKNVYATMEEAQAALELLIKRGCYHVWDHFTTYIASSVGCYTIRCKCLYCSKCDYSCDTTNNGTKAQLTHLDKCREYAPNKEKLKMKQTTLSNENPTQVAIGFNQKDITKVCVEMVILDELSFSFVQGVGFRRFCERAIPKWKVPCRQTIARDVLNMYYTEKRELRDMLSAYRVCITTDTWTSCQNINYMVVTAHFIDVNWKLHKKIINFCVIPNHKGESISRLLEECLLDWGIEKLLTVTVDNASANDAGLSDLIKRMSRWQNSNALLLRGQNLHVRCIAHILNLIVKDGLGQLNSCIQSIRNAVRYCRSSPQRLETFKTCVEKVKLVSKGLVVMDVPTRWNSTYLMLQSALKFRLAFDRLRDDDPAYESYFISDKVIGPPNDVDWKNAEIFATFLKSFYEITLRVCCSNFPTVHHAFMDVFRINNLLHKTNSIVELNAVRSSMQSKYYKYWGDLAKVNKYFFLAIVLDPRHKLDKVRDFLEVLCGNVELVVEEYIKEVKDLLSNLYSIYRANVSIVVESSQSEATSGVGGNTSCISNDNDMSSDMDMEMMLLQKSRMRKARLDGIIHNDLDRYLSDIIEGDLSETFNILDWWKVNGVPKYPILALIARDILAIPVSTIAFESCFSTSGRIIDSFRSSLSPKMVEALICTQNWLRGDHVALQHIPTTEEMELCERIEKEIAKDVNTMLPPKRS